MAAASSKAASLPLSSGNRRPNARSNSCSAMSAESEESSMNADPAALEGVVYDFTVPAKQPWSRVVEKGHILRIIDLEGQQAVDFLCYDAKDPGDRYNGMNTIKVQGNT